MTPFDSCSPACLHPNTSNRRNWSAILLPIVLFVTTFYGFAHRLVAEAEAADEFARVAKLVADNKLIAARPILQSIRADADDATKAKIDFYLALSYVYEYYESENQQALNAAEKGFTDFLRIHRGHPLEGLARYNLADVYAMSQEFKEALKLYIPLYRNPPSALKPKDIRKKIILIYAAEKEWEAGMSFFADAMNDSTASTNEWATAAAYLMIAQAKQGTLSDTGRLLEFFTSPAPIFYTPLFNNALMEVGDQLRETGDLITASMFYQCVRDYETLEAGLTRYIADLEKHLEDLGENSYRRNELVETRAKLDNARADLEAVKLSEDYTPLLQWRIANVHMKMERDWEAFWRFKHLAKTYPYHDHAESILYSAISLSDQLNLAEHSLELGKAYIQNEDFQKFRAEISTQISEQYLETNDYEGHLELSQEIIALSPDDQAARILLFNHAVSRMEALDTQELIKEFSILHELYGGSENGFVLDYFIGLSYMIEEDYEITLEKFNRVLNDSSSLFRADVTFRKAQALIGLDRLEEARSQIEAFIAGYPDNALRATAEFTLGNVVDMLGEKATALTHYYRVAEHTEEVEQLTQAELRIADIFHRRRESETAIERLESFIQTHASNPFSIPASRRLATLFEETEEPRKALLSIQRPILSFYDRTDIQEADALLLDYLKLDNTLRTMREKTEQFFETVIADGELLEALVNDRAKQFDYFRENPKIDPLVSEIFAWDDAFRKAVLEEISALSDLQDHIENLNTQIPEQSATDWALEM